MLEDIIVSARHIGSESELCTLCGAPYPRHLLGLREDGAAGSMCSEHADVCPACDRLLDSGDAPAFSLDEEHGRIKDQSRYQHLAP